MEESKLDLKTTLDCYLDGPEQLEAALSGLDEAALDSAMDAESWSIRQIVHHVADGDSLWGVAIRIALGEDGTWFDLKWYWQIEQKQWADRWAYASRPVAPSLSLLKANRFYIAALAQAVPGAGERTVQLQFPDHPVMRASVVEILDSQACHVFGHIEDIRKICRLHGL